MLQQPRIRLYGFIPMTRGRYVRQLVVALVLAVVGLSVWWWKWPAFRDELVRASPLLDRFITLMNLLPWLILATVILQLLEAYVVFRLFRRKQTAVESDTSGVRIDGDATQSPLSETGAGCQITHQGDHG